MGPVVFLLYDFQFSYGEHATGDDGRMLCTGYITRKLWLRTAVDGRYAGTTAVTDHDGRYAGVS